MYILRIEHSVPDYAAWKKVFDSDPLDRWGSGVRRYRVFTQVEDPHVAMIDLEFDSVLKAEAMQTSLRGLWQRVEGELMTNARAEIYEVVEEKALEVSRAA